MVRVVFKNLVRSEMFASIAEQKVQEALQRYPIDVRRKIVLTLSTGVGTLKTGSGQFHAKLEVYRRQGPPLFVQKSSSSAYGALAGVIDIIPHLVNSLGDKVRVKERQLSRRLKQHAPAADYDHVV